MPIDAIIFDLDGTLVDSADGVLSSIAGAFRKCGMSPTRPLNNEIIGPSLEQILYLLTNSEDPRVIKPLTVEFKNHYDTQGYRATKVYSGVNRLLGLLEKSSRPLFIATNKRKRPTDEIVNWLGWEKYFEAVYSLDTIQPPAANKGALISQILLAHQLKSEDTLYVGDRDEDHVAATQARVQFYRATWGYGNFGTFDVPESGIKKLMELLALPTGK